MILVCTSHSSSSSHIHGLTGNDDSIQHLRDLKTFFGTTFKIKALAELSAPSAEDFVERDEGDDTVMAMGTSKGVSTPEAFILSCVGTGFTNTAKKT